MKTVSTVASLYALVFWSIIRLSFLHLLKII